MFLLKYQNSLNLRFIPTFTPENKDDEDIALAYIFTGFPGHHDVGCRGVQFKAVSVSFRIASQRV